MGKKDETANRAIAISNRAHFPMSMLYDTERETSLNGDRYIVTVSSKYTDSVLSAKTDIIAKFAFHEAGLRRMKFVRTDEPNDSMTLDTAGRFYLGNMLGKNRNRVDELKKEVRDYIEANFRQCKYSQDGEMYAKVVQKLKTEYFINIFREIAKRESLRMMAMKPPVW